MDVKRRKILSNWLNLVIQQTVCIRVGDHMVGRRVKFFVWIRVCIPYIILH